MGMCTILLFRVGMRAGHLSLPGFPTIREAGSDEDLLLFSAQQKLRKQREATKARKEENRRKSLVTQKISNPATLKRMMASKKGRKKLVTVDAVKATK